MKDQAQLLKEGKELLAELYSDLTKTQKKVKKIESDIILQKEHLEIVGKQEWVGK